MKNIWIVQTDVYDGTVIISSNASAFATESLAREVEKAINETNKHNTVFKVLCRVKETPIYEESDRESIPILNIKYQ